MFKKGKNNLKLLIKILLPSYITCMITWYLFFQQSISFSLGNTISWLLSMIMFFNIFTLFELKFYGGGISFSKNKEEKSPSTVEKVIILFISMVSIVFLLNRIFKAIE